MIYPVIDNIKASDMFEHVESFSASHSLNSDTPVNEVLVSMTAAMLSSDSHLDDLRSAFSQFVIDNECS